MEEVLEQLLESVSVDDDLEGITRPTLELLEKFTGLESTYLTKINLAADTQIILFSRNSRTLTIPEGLEVPWGDTLCKRALEEERPFTDDVTACWSDSQAASELGIRTYLSQPVLRTDGSVFGTLCAASDRNVPMDDCVVNVLAKFAKIIGEQVEREIAVRRLSAVVQELSSHVTADPLTGLANRRGMLQELRRMMKHAARENLPVVAAFVDLDDFKQVNDEFGHHVGDAFLIHISRRLIGAVRARDHVSRSGGDEFVVLAIDADPARLTERLEEAMTGPFSHGDVSFVYPGASIGVARANPGETDVDKLLREADKAMYRAKRQRKAGQGDDAERAVGEGSSSHRG
ncbi:sensor domain-containing diguanylate cyclase [uncultured Abyssibacter sp.]|uniref:sensor domain-containing diguanylate cyclase n=1 Tax=uncultured Abyssibacter sp. TaxID=2320202 RepID=UPI0032B1DA10